MRFVEVALCIKKLKTYSELIGNYWVPQKLPQIYSVIAYICIGKVTRFAVYICGNIWNALYMVIIAC